MNTTQKIQAVLATGKLGLPDDLWQPGSNYWSLGYDMEDREHVITDQQAYDLIACEWARDIYGKRWFSHYEIEGHVFLEKLGRLFTKGDSEAAISAIWAALCGEDVDDPSTA